MFLKWQNRRRYPPVEQSFAMPLNGVPNIDNIFKMPINHIFSAYVYL